MSIGSDNYPNGAAITTDYPHGGIKDDTGVGDGTPVNKLVYDDIHQTFRKILLLSAITPNGLPDNVTNGYQYNNAMDALYKKFTGVKYVTGVASVTLTSADYGKLVVVDSSAGQVDVILPASVNLRDGDAFTVFNNDINLVLVRRTVPNGFGINQNYSTGISPLIIQLPSVYDFGEFVLSKGSGTAGTWYAANLRASTAPLWVSPPTLLNSWTNSASPFKYYVSPNGHVSFEGLVVNSSSGSTVFFTLPFAPSYQRNIPVLVNDGTITLKMAQLTIDTSGNCSITKGATATANNGIVLDGVSFWLS